ncbi:hypothetical protein [Coprobacter secundus]|uniref:Lipoprotein n=1 Tax=Coprobacter secundus subsp. similis TaxID=2751153 RepID=A0A7G1I0I4_9BACT|nr:hypothetical protein [Coprobacter secundus]BCI63938.1 hypothetical protein Cop2CBH44_22910 [Coprobacter secundus subsp. similis]
MYNIQKYIRLFLFMLTGILVVACNEEYPYTEIPEDEMPLRQLVGKNYGTQNFYVGMVPGNTAFFDPVHNDYRLLFTKEFSVLSVDTAFFQDALLKGPREQFSDILYRPYFASARQYNMYMYVKAGLSDNTSKWMQDDNDRQNTPENIEIMVNKMFSRLSSDLAANIDVVKWMEVIKDPFAPSGSSEYFYQNPWMKLGYSDISYQDGSQTVYIPRYIVLALQIANQNAPSVKKIISQSGELDIVIWERMQKMLAALRTAGIDVDGMAWNATFEDDDSGSGYKWTYPTHRTENEKLLGELIDWCSRNRFEFHITSIELQMRNFDAIFGLTNEFAVEVSREDQKEVFHSLMSVVLPRIGKGISTLQFNGFQDIIPEEGDSGINPRLFNVKNEPTVLYYELRNLLSK